MTEHTLVLAGVLAMGVGVPLLPTNSMKLAATVLGYLVAVAGATYVLAHFQWSWIAVCALVLFATMVVSTLLSPGRKPIIILPSLTRADGLVTQGVYLAMVLLASQFGPADREVILQAMIYASIGVALVAFWQSHGEAQWALCAGLSPEQARTHFRAMGTLANPLFLGGYCTLVLPIAVARSIMWMHTADMLAAGALVYAAIASGSRSTWLALGITLPFTALIPPLGHVPIVLGMVYAIAGIVAYARRQHLTRASVKEIMKDSVHSTVSGRRYIGKLMWAQIRERPIFGHGMNVFAKGNPDPAAQDFFDKAHCDVLDTAFAIGFVGLAAYLALWAVAFWGAPVMLLAGLAAYFIWAQFGWQHLGPASVFYAIIGLTAFPIR